MDELSANATNDVLEVLMVVSVDCPRCGGYMSTRYDENTCVHCGYVVYGDVENKNKVLPYGMRLSILKLPYVGDYEECKRMVVDVHTGHSFSGGVIDGKVYCPWCFECMAYTSGSSNRKHKYKAIGAKRIMVYSCSLHHNIRLLVGKGNDVYGWE